MKDSGIRWTTTGLALALAFGLVACGGDANGSDAERQVSETAAAAQEMAGEAVEAVGEAAEGMAEKVGGMMEQELPAGVTPEMVARGKTVYAGAGICSSCHGPAGQGVPNLGAPLTDGEWLHSDGSYEGIVKTVMSGVTAQKSSSGVPMPAKGGTNISDDDAKAVAAYVWSLGHGGK
ncbi:MAG: c-type cytochrome [Gemmatimonadota bacterium]|jgi:mono/diheme cytochrome c family protein